MPVPKNRRRKYTAPPPIESDEELREILEAGIMSTKSYRNDEFRLGEAAQMMAQKYDELFKIAASNGVDLKGMVEAAEAAVKAETARRREALARLRELAADEDVTEEELNEAMAEYSGVNEPEVLDDRDPSEIADDSMDYVKSVFFPGVEFVTPDPAEDPLYEPDYEGGSNA